jgi:hypothetical protein
MLSELMMRTAPHPMETTAHNPFPPSVTPFPPLTHTLTHSHTHTHTHTLTHSHTHLTFFFVAPTRTHNHGTYIPSFECRGVSTTAWAGDWVPALPLLLALGLLRRLCISTLRQGIHPFSLSLSLCNPPPPSSFKDPTHPRPLQSHTA